MYNRNQRYTEQEQVKSHKNIYLIDFIEKTRHALEKQEELDFGLAIAHTIVTMHGGNIKITDNEPKGTKVIIKI